MAAQKGLAFVLEMDDGTGTAFTPVAAGRSDSFQLQTATIDITDKSRVLEVGAGDASYGILAIFDDVTLRHVVSGNNTALTVGVSSHAITVNVATDGDGLATSTGADVLAAIEASADAMDLLTQVYLAGSSDGSGVVSAFTALTARGVWRRLLPGVRSFTFTGASLYMESDDARDLIIAAVEDQDAFNCKVTLDGTDIFTCGSALVTNLTLEGTHDGVSTYTCTVEGTGELTA
jgi:predicted secreted protein